MGQGAGKRIELIDAMRGMAIFLMVIFHLSWDLSFFGLADIEVTSDPFWVWFARFIAGMILLVSGMSFAFASFETGRRRAFILRILKIGLCAGLISLATYQMDPQSTVYFGILHHLTLASLILLVLSRLPNQILLLLAAGIVTAKIWLFTPEITSIPLSWIGLWYPPGYPVDYVPLAPWLALPIIGLVVGRWMKKRPDALEVRAPAWMLNPLLLAGRHSLLIYMMHQPILFGLLWLLVTYIL